jgi:cell division protein FtsN
MKEAQAVIAQRSKPKGNMTRTIVTMLVIMAGALLFAIINQIIKANKENANEVSANASPSNVASFEGDIITTTSTAPASTSYIRTSSPTPSTPIAQSLDFPSTQTVKCVGPIQADDEGLFY